MRTPTKEREIPAYVNWPESYGAHAFTGPCLWDHSQLAQFMPNTY